MMKSILTVLLATLGASAAHAQWQTTTYSFKSGWNSMWLHGDATHATPGQLFPPATNVVEIWRWNPNPDQVQFTSTPLEPSSGTAEWSVWRRDNPAANTLQLMTGQTGYLVRVATGVSTSSVPVPQRVVPPRASWVRNGANLLGFPTRRNGSSFPPFTSYFASFPSATSGKIYRYNGGELSASNPLQLFSASSERVDRNQAYWFETQAVESFVGPVELIPSDPAGLVFGRTGTTLTLRLRNRTQSPQTVGLLMANSEAPPSGQEGIAGPVPLTLRTFDTATASYIETPVTGQIVRSIPAGATIEVQFGINRTAMIAANNALFASLLRVTDAANLMDAYLPVTARSANLAGLWAGEARVDGVASTAPGSPGSTTSREFPLRYLFHIDDAGTVRMISQAFLGALDSEGSPFGICTVESALDPKQLADASRIVATHLPPGYVANASGGFGNGGTLQCTVQIPFNAPTNPFVHQYHPDHDNRDARFRPADAGVESYNIVRALAFTFSPTAPAGTTTTGWGSTVLAGSYAETITGIHKEPMRVTGTFQLRRISDLGSITLD